MDRFEERLKALMLDSLAGNDVSYRVLLREVGERLRVYYARRLKGDPASADDLTQETLIAIHTRRATYDRERPVSAWLFAIARYKLIDHLRSSRQHMSVPFDETVDALFAPDDVAAAEAQSDLNRVLAEVPPATRGLIRAVKIEGQSVAEVSAASGMSESAVKVAIHRGLKRLAERLNPDKGHDET